MTALADVLSSVAPGLVDSDISRWLNLLPAPLKKALQVKTFEEVGPLYHMSLNGNIKKFIPNVSRRTMHTENVSVPRISTAPTLLGCFIGYVAHWGDMSWPDPRNKTNKNGWYLYQLPYERAIKPGLRELSDQELSDEHWLVTYNEKTRTYTGEIIAKLFFSEMSILPRTQDYPEERIKLVVEVFAETMRWSGEHVLTRGYWMVEGRNPNQVKDWNVRGEYTVRKLSGGEYSKLKGLSADLLSLEPPVLRW